MGHDHITHIQTLMAEDSLGDRKHFQEPISNEPGDGRSIYCNSHIGGFSCPQFISLQSAHKSSDLYMSRVKGSQSTEPGSSTVTCIEQDVHMKCEGDDICKLKDTSGNTQQDTAQVTFNGAHILCKHENCRKKAQENTEYCKLHNGGAKGCMVRGCTKAAHGSSPLCIGHGGGKRCTVNGCPNAACGQGRSEHCVRHGGGKRCKFEGCGKGAQGNTDFCIRHGGGRRCKSEGCTKSAQGRTDFCIRHGGGTRCKFVGCNTSAKWATDYCSLHRKGLLDGDSANPEAPLVPSEKHPLVKKAKKAATPSGLPQEIVTTTAAITGSGTQETGNRHVTTMFSNRDLSSKIVTAARHGAIASPQLAVPLPMKSPTASGTVVSANREVPEIRAMLGL